MSANKLKKVMSFIVVESDSKETIPSRFIINSGYKLIDTVENDSGVKYLYAWDSEYGVYLYWDEDFIASMVSLGKRFKVSALMWDSHVGLMWFNSTDSPMHGLFNVNSIVDDEVRETSMSHVEKVLEVLNDEEQSLLCLVMPWMAGFFSNVQLLVKLSNSNQFL